MMPQFPSRRWLKAVLIIVWCWPTFPGCFASCDITFKVYLQTGESDKVVLKDEQRQAYGGGGAATFQSQSCTEDEEKGGRGGGKESQGKKDADMKIII